LPVSIIKSSEEAPIGLHHVTPVASDIADPKRGECESRAVTASSHNPKDHSGALRTGGLSRSAGSPHEDRTDGASIGISGQMEARGVTVTT